MQGFEADGAGRPTAPPFLGVAGPPVEDVADALLEVGEVVRVDDDLHRAVRRQRLVVGAVREGDRAAEAHVVGGPVLAGGGDATQVVHLVCHLAEGVLDAVGGAIAVHALPLATGAPDAAALDLDDHDPQLGVGDHEVRLAIARGLAGLLDEPGGGVVDDEGLGQLVAERLFEAGFGVRRGIHAHSLPRLRSSPGTGEVPQSRAISLSAGSTLSRSYGSTTSRRRARGTLSTPDRGRSGPFRGS